MLAELQAFDPLIDIEIRKARRPDHGDLSTNIALTLAKKSQHDAIYLAEQIVSRLPRDSLIDDIKIAAPGFINFFIHPHGYLPVVLEILQKESQYGISNIGAGRKVLLEFVSANPTGPLHVGHGRGAVYGSVLANLMRHCGFQVDCEYYVNDSGLQIEILTTSIWLRYLEYYQTTLPFPKDLYQGDYIKTIASQLHTEHQDKFYRQLPEKTFVPQDEKPLELEKFIKQAQEILSEQAFIEIQDYGLSHILGNIRADLNQLGVQYQQWFSENTLLQDQKITDCIQRLEKQGHCYKKDGALYFQTSKLGDEKDRVLIRSNGKTTYFAADIAYHLTKFERGYDWIVNIWGADHHGYVARVKAAIQALGKPIVQLDILLVQFVSLYQNGEKLPMSTRSGQFILLSTLLDQVGCDATRFYYTMRKNDQHLDFDLALATAQSNKNPVYYIQYAYARIFSVLALYKQKGYSLPKVDSLTLLEPLIEVPEQKLMATLSQYPAVVEAAAEQLAPHQLCHYLSKLANNLHSYYNAYQFISEEKKIREARVALIQAIGEIIRDGLNLLGISAPEKM